MQITGNSIVCRLNQTTKSTPRLHITGYEAARSLWNLTGTSAVVLPRRLANVTWLLSFQHPVSRLRDCARSASKISYRLVNREYHIHVSTIEGQFFINLRGFKMFNNFHTNFRPISHFHTRKTLISRVAKNLLCPQNRRRPRKWSRASSMDCTSDTDFFRVTS